MPFAFLLLAAATASPPTASQTVSPLTVDQFAALLSKARNEKDAKLARRLSKLKLTERASAATLAQWDAEFPGKRTRQALAELADASAFLHLPPSEIPNQPAPDAAALRQILVRSIAYVNKTLRKLPDFYALRTTTSFEDQAATIQDRQFKCGPPGLLLPCPPQVHATSRAPSGETPLRLAGQFSTTVTYVDGQEVDGSGFDSLSLSLPKLGLVTNGEFGPILTVTLGDALKGEIYWSHWEKGPTGLLAVLRYTVPADQSHYRVTLPGEGGEKPILPAYHGQFAIDPTNGAIYRITVIANPDPSHKNVITAIMVEYSSVVIGGMPYICPVKGVAFSKWLAPYPAADGQSEQPLLVTRLNDITFTRYHLFRSEMKILPDASTNLSPPTRPRLLRRH